VNNKPLPVEKAEVSMKGKISAMPLLMTYCTNYEGAGLNGICKDPIPFWRRFKFWVEVVPLPEFALANGSLDVDKAEQKRTHDMWRLRVRRFDPALINKDNHFVRVPFTQGEIMSFPDFVRLVRAEFTQNLNR